MKRIILLLLGLLLICLAGPVAGQNVPVIDVLQVQLWPEYDLPSMLVIYTLQLPADQILPVEVTVQIPASVGEPSAVAVLEDTTLVTRQYSRTVDGDWAEITLEADFPVIQLEYYDTSLSQQDQPRRYDFRWLSDYNVSSLILSVKQPPNASGMSIDPSLGSGLTGADGLTNYSSSLGPWPSGQTFSLTLSYNKSDTSLGVQAASQSGSPSQGTPAASVTGPLPPWGWALIGLGVVVLVVGGVLFYRSNRSSGYSGTYQRKKQKAQLRGKSRSRPYGKPGRFCHQCGTQAVSGDKFCRECGTKLRV